MTIQGRPRSLILALTKSAHGLPVGSQ